MSYKIEFTKNGLKDYKLIQKSQYSHIAKKLLLILETDPYVPPYEPLIGNYKGLYSRRINIQHRLVYEINENTKTVKIRSMWTHYGDN